MLDSIFSKGYTDTEINHDSDFLREEIEKALESLSSFDEYIAELFSGKLDWSLVHTSSSFWKENLKRFHENRINILK